MSTTSVLQTGGFSNIEPFSFAPYSGQPFEISLYSSLREAVPIIDAAIHKLVRLIGHFKVECQDKYIENELSSFLERVKVDGGKQGIDSFLSCYFEQLLTFGTAVGEIVTDGNPDKLILYNASLKDIALRRNPKNFLEIEILNTSGIEPRPVKKPQLILLSVLNPDATALLGNSLLKGLPFVSAVLLKIYKSLGQNWERVGNVRFAVTYKPQNDAIDRAYAKERALQIAKEWGEAMQSSDTVKDFVAVGDVNIKVIGAENQIPDSEIPVRQMLEQIIAKTGLPPFLLGLNWSTTERMSSQQADLLTSELEYYRGILNPIILKVCKAFLRLKGLDSECKVLWEDITLFDEVEQAKARLLRAEANRLEYENNKMEKEV